MGAGFYLGYSWLPSFFVKHVGIPQATTMWMTLSGMILYTMVVPVSAGSVPEQGVMLQHGEPPCWRAGCMDVLFAVHVGAVVAQPWHSWRTPQGGCQSSGVSLIDGRYFIVLEALIVRTSTACGMFHTLLLTVLPVGPCCCRWLAGSATRVWAV